MASLAELAAQAADCTKCPLSLTRTQVVFGVGDPHAPLMFVGEGPGKDEDEQGEPFVGRSGKLLDQVLFDEFGVKRERVYIANVVKCLRYNTMVQLGDGSWERIGRLVRQRYAGTVMAVDEAGHILPKRVIGWHATPLNGRRVFRLTYRSAKKTGRGPVAIELTGDHPVLTEYGYVRADELTSGVLVSTGQGLSELARDVVCGTLLGDGHLNARSAHLSFSHSSDQREYALFKASLLDEEFGIALADYKIAAAVGATQLHDVINARTLASRSLRILRGEFYGPRKFVPAWMSEALTPRMVAFWFMDDGHMRIRTGRQPRAEIATDSFDRSGLSTLIAGLERLGVHSYVRTGRLQFGVVDAKKLSALIAPYVPASMRYKLHPEIAEAIPFDPTSFERGPIQVMFDEVVVEETTDRPRSDTTFFCIDVEDTHNFVTMGGVVHNCRPPGNRDPLPDEIVACRPWLEAQLDLIAPKVVITLGNFATKLLLLGDTKAKEGITKLRGKAYPWRNGAVLVPTFHPSAVLRNGGGQPLAQMRADFIRAKQALADAGVVL